MQALTPEPVYGMPEDLEQLLDGAVLAVAAVQGDEADVGRELAQARDEVVADVDGRAPSWPRRSQRVLDARAGPQRDLALQRAPALRTATRLMPAARRAQAQDAGQVRAVGRRLSAGRLARDAGAAACPVSVPKSSSCSATTSPMRRTPSRISSSATPEKFSRIESPPRPSR